MTIIETIKSQLLNKQITLIAAAKKLSAHNGNPLAGNLKIAERWVKGF